MFDFEKYWNESGVKTDPEIMGLAFKECAQKAVSAALKHQSDEIRTILSNCDHVFSNISSLDTFVRIECDDFYKLQNIIKE